MSPTSGKDWLQRYEKRAGKKHPSVSKPKPVVAKPKPKPTRRGGEVGNDARDAIADKFLRDTKGDAVKTKDTVVSTMSEMSGLDKDMVNLMIGQWAGTSNNHNPQALSMQEAVSEEFSVPLSDWQKENIAFVNKGEGIGPLMPKGPVRGWGSRDEERALLKAMHDNTQAELKKAGYKPGDTISLYRGASVPLVSTRRKGVSEGYSGNAMESWSINKAAAREFAYNHGDAKSQGVILNMHVPIENILGTARTGFGCLDEGEFVILGSLPSEARPVYIRGGAGI